MHRTSLLTILSLVPLTLSTAIPSDGWELDKRQRPVRPCSHLTGGVHVIAAGGDGVQNTGQYGLIGSLATRILQAIPGSTNVTLPYDKSRNGAQVPKIDQGVCLTSRPTWLNPSHHPDARTHQRRCSPENSLRVERLLSACS